MTFSFPTPRPLTTYTPVSDRAISSGYFGARGGRRVHSTFLRCVFDHTPFPDGIPHSPAFRGFERRRRTYNYFAFLSVRVALARTRAGRSRTVWASWARQRSL